MASLEELEGAEEELLRQNGLLGEHRAAEDRLVFHYKQLFSDAPVPVLITNRYGSIEETIAVAMLFRREAQQVRAIVSLVPDAPPAPAYSTGY